MDLTLLEYTKTDRYKKILTDYLDALKKLQEFGEWYTAESKVREFTQEKTKELKDAYSAYRKELIDSYNKKMLKIETDFKNNREKYKDPQTEILNRQDFDMKLSLMSVGEVVSMLKDPVKIFTRYELTKILSTYPDNADVIAYVNEHIAIDEEGYQRDPEYISLLTKRSLLERLGSMGIDMCYILDETDPKGYQTKDLNLAGKKWGALELMYEIQSMQELMNRAYPKKEEQQDNTTNWVQMTP